MGAEIIDEDSLHYKDKIYIGDYVYIGGGSNIWAIGGLVIGEGTIIGPRITIHTSNHAYDEGGYLPYGDISYLQSVSIGKYVWIGDNVMICPGSTIGEGAIIGMGSVVSGEVPECAVAVGNPVRVIKYRDKNKYAELKDSGSIYLRAKEAGDINHFFCEKGQLN